MRNLLYCSLLIVVCVLPPQGESATGTTDEVRLLIVMGGGSYESSVFRFFDTLEGVSYTLVMSDKEAFEKNIRQHYDAVLMYNLSKSLPEPARSNLERFVKGGGGLVVWHHALANYGDWPWWYREVVGGRYLLEADKEYAASKYRQDESIMATVTGEHPVVASLEGHPMHIYDETYKGLWIADEIEVLLKTTLSTSDGPLVWVGPYRDARVVVVQPGHGSSAYFNLGLRHIIRDAIHWVAATSGSNEY